MSSVSIDTTSFAGFRTLGSRPVLLLGLVVLHLFSAVISVLIVVGLFGRRMMDFMQASAAGQKDPTAVLKMMPGLLGMELLSCILGLLIMSISCCAIYRAILRPEERGFAYLKLGGDEFRLAVVFLVYLVLAFVVTMAVTIGIGILAAVIGATSQGAGSSALIVVVAMLVLLFGSLAVLTKLSLAGPMTFAERRIALFDSWGATRGAFWSLFVSYLIVWIILFMLSLLIFVLLGVMATAVLGMGGGFLNAIQQLARPDMSSFATYFTPFRIVTLAFGAVMNALVYILLVAPGAAAYQQLVGSKADVSRAF